MKLLDFDFKLPPELIAQHPAQRRDASRLLVVHRDSGRIEHRQFDAFLEYPARGDMVVANDTKVLPARLACRRIPGGGRTELLLLTEAEPCCWRALARPRGKLKPGARLEIGHGACVVTIERFEEDAVLVRFPKEADVFALLNAHGETPLPPYIHRPSTDLDQQRLDRERYQTIYARMPGSVAAPTAGLHFTPTLLNQLEGQGVVFGCVTLQIGYGTFQPIRGAVVEQHRMHAEFCDVPSQVVASIHQRKAEGGTIWAVGTTTVRALETAGISGSLASFQGMSDLYIYPGFHFTTTDHLLTNFHLPKSSLFLMVCALAGRETMLHAYREAIRERYRFYSFGDAMLII